MKKNLLLFLGIIISNVFYAQNIKLPDEPKLLHYTDYALKNSGFWCAIENTTVCSVILDYHNIQRTDLLFTCGYRLNEFFRTGLGIGSSLYFNGNADVRGDNHKLTLPIFFNLRGNIISQDVYAVVPYWSVDVGKNLEDGVYFSPTIGIRVGQKRNSFLVGLNYALAEIKTDYDDIYSNYISYLGLKIGYEF